MYLLRISGLLLDFLPHFLNIACSAFPQVSPYVVVLFDILSQVVSQFEFKVRPALNSEVLEAETVQQLIISVVIERYAALSDSFLRRRQLPC